MLEKKTTNKSMRKRKRRPGKKFAFSLKGFTDCISARENQNRETAKYPTGYQI